MRRSIPPLASAPVASISTTAASTTAADEHAGAVEPFEDAALYDWEYRRRRSDVAFYRMLASERGGPVLDLGCGTGRLAVPLVRDGHQVLGVDLSLAMLTRAETRLKRLARPISARCLLVRADFRALPLRGRFPLVIAAFHSIQHLVDDRDLLAFLRTVRRVMDPKGWFAFDVFHPQANWLGRPPDRRFDRTVFHHPVTRQRLAYSVSQRLDHARRALHMRFSYQPIGQDGTPSGIARSVRLCHRQLPPDDLAALLRRAGFHILARWGGFNGEPLNRQNESDTEQHVYLTRPARRAGGKPSRKAGH